MAKKKTPAAEGDAEKKGGKGKIIVIAACAGLGIGGYMLGSGGAEPAADASAPTTTLYQKPGCHGLSKDEAPLTVVDLDSMSINLAEDHYLRATVSLGLCDDVIVGEAEPFIEAPAKDIIVSTLSGMEMAELATASGRDAVKEELTEKILEAYPGEVYEVYLSEFVMQ